MPNETFQSSRPWRQIAQDLIHEMKPQRVTELSNELSKALDEQIHCPDDDANSIRMKIKSGFHAN
jgi:hypothetical protein